MKTRWHATRHTTVHRSCVQTASSITFSAPCANNSSVNLIRTISGWPRFRAARETGDPSSFYRRDSLFTRVVTWIARVFTRIKSAISPNANFDVNAPETKPLHPNRENKRGVARCISFYKIYPIRSCPCHGRCRNKSIRFHVGVRYLISRSKMLSAQRHRAEPRLTAVG